MRLRSILVMLVLAVAAGVVFFALNRQPESPAAAQDQEFVWSLEFEELKKITIRLPREGKSEAWVKHPDKYWYFDRPGGPEVDTKRWGGGIPLLLSGPGAKRFISGESTDEQLKVYGFSDPRMMITLILETEGTIDVEVGDRTPDGTAYYVKRVDSRSIHTVDQTWYAVLERLVLEPPYPEPGGK